MTEHLWQKSSYCGSGEACISTAAAGGTVLLTETADPSGTVLHTTPETFAALTHALKEQP